jgi:CBS-domain-containing membrane protein
VEPEARVGDSRNGEETMFEGDITPKERQITMTETVDDFLNDVVSKAVTVGTDATLREALDARLASGATRKVYVVDEKGKLRGTISVETLMRHVANRIGARPPGVISWLKFINDMESDNVVNFMAKPIPVTRRTLIIDIVRNVVMEHLNDFPVLEDDGRLIGEVNTFNLLKIARSAFAGGAKSQ